MILMADSRESMLTLLFSEVAQMKELAMQLGTDQLDRQHSPVEFCNALAARMLSSIDRLICMAATLSNADQGGRQQQQQQVSFPHTAVGDAFATENLAPAFGYHCRSLSKKRKLLPRRKVQMKVNASSGQGGIAASLDDGYCWRKYGNKSILGATHPRSYYRCKDRVSKNCLATKQVQRSEEDPQVFDIVYHGNHTCRRSSSCLQVPNNDDDYFDHLTPLPPNRDLLLEFQAAGQSVKTEAMGAEEAKNVSFLVISSSTSCTTSESDCLFDELYLPSESNSEGDFVLVDRDFRSTGFDAQLEELLSPHAYEMYLNELNFDSIS